MWWCFIMDTKKSISGVTRSWKVFGTRGKPQSESFLPSCRYDFSNNYDGIRILKLENSDITGTNLYTVIHITRNTAEECQHELDGQISDGFFENSAVGKVVEII